MVIDHKSLGYRAVSIISYLIGLTSGATRVGKFRLKITGQGKYLLVNITVKTWLLPMLQGQVGYIKL